ncbi:MAG: RsmD family RNA methyltransferase [Chlamydiales bacterium]
MIRITGGRFRGRTIYTPRTHLTKPGTQRLRKAFFDISRNDIEDANFLDLFAGSGAFGIEALSRGAKHSTFVDKGTVAIACIKKNIALLQIEEQSTIFSTTYEYWYKKNTTPFDIAYASPPYPDIHLYKKILKDFYDKPYAKLFYVESAKKLILPQHALEPEVTVRQYGDSYLYSFSLQ